MNKEKQCLLSIVQVASESIAWTLSFLGLPTSAVSKPSGLPVEEGNPKYQILQNLV
jgi:hypothetical protein